MRSRTQKSKIPLRILCAAMVLCGAAVVVRSASAQDAPPQPTAEHPQTAPQDPGTPVRAGKINPERRSQKLKEQLGLSDAQTTQVKTIFEDERTKNQALVADQTGDQQAMRTKLADIRKDSETRISAILTPDQKTKWDAARAEQPRRGKGVPPPSGTPAPHPPAPQQ
jgi:Spy/CpxP family protein refolding chaperone